MIMEFGKKCQFKENSFMLSNSKLIHVPSLKISKAPRAEWQAIVYVINSITEKKVKISSGVSFDEANSKKLEFCNFKRA